MTVTWDGNLWNASDKLNMPFKQVCGRILRRQQLQAYDSEPAKSLLPRCVLSLPGAIDTGQCIAAQFLHKTGISPARVVKIIAKEICTI